MLKSTFLLLETLFYALETLSISKKVLERTLLLKVIFLKRAIRAHWWKGRRRRRNGGALRGKHCRIYNQKPVDSTVFKRVWRSSSSTVVNFFLCTLGPATGGLKGKMFHEFVLRVPFWVTFSTPPPPPILGQLPAQVANNKLFPSLVATPSPPRHNSPILIR